MRLVMRDVEDSEITGGRVTGPLHLFRDPLLVLEGATKRYVDAIPNNLSASLITGGTLRNNMLPAWDGEVTTAAGNRVISIKSTVAANTYQSVNVNIKGLVVGGGPLVVSDIPNLNWSKISKGRPTSLAGYGITDGINLNGGSLTGSLVLSRNPVLNNEVATKNYSDEIGMLTSLNPGDIIRKLTPVTPTGFLKCNEGVVDKGLYADLYAVIGDRFKRVVRPGAGKPWKQQYDINTVGDSLRAWATATTSLPQALGRSQAVVTSSRVYLIGGNNSGGPISTIYTAPINEDGTLGAWATATSLPGGLSFSQAVVTKNRVYLLGGNNGSVVSVSTVYTAPINEDGTLGVWTTATSLPQALADSQAVVTSSRVYLLGGYNASSYLSTVYTAPINEDGTLGAWTTATTSLPGVLASSQAVVTSSRVYLIGGFTGSSRVSTVYTAPINEDGTLGAWATTTSLPGGLSSSQAVVTKNRVYLLGGYNGGRVSTVYTAPINEDGTLGAWTTATSLPQALDNSQAVVTSSRVYLLGGQTDSSFLSTVYTATLSGGKNDYSEYYDKTNAELDDTTKFTLPYLNSDGQYYYYIKY